MQFPAVNWHEGLFLQPHHFQAWDRYWSERVSAGEQWQNPYFYGIFEISINSAALLAGYFQLDTLKARTPGGTLLELSTGQQSERCDLRAALEENGNGSVSSSGQFVQGSTRLDVYIGVPRLQLGGRNVDRGAGGSVNRFTSELFELPDEVDASSVQPIELRKINAHLLHSGQDLSGYDVLPVARIRRASDGATLELDPSFIPPLLDCSAWPALRSQILSPISDLLLRASEQAGQAIADAGKTLQPSTPLQFQRLLLLQAVNPAASILRVMTNSRGIHPQTAYLELSRLAGSLDLFHPQRSVQDTRPYDHENLGPIFLQLKQRVVTALTLFDNKPYFQKFLVGNDLGMQTAIDQDASGHTQWFIGINKGKVPLETLHQLLSPRHLDWKVGSVQQVEWLFTQRAPGVELDPVSELPSVLPRSNEWAYFKVNTSSDAWTDVMATKSLGIRLKDSLIANRGELPGSKHLVVQHASQPLTLQIALFGVS